MEAVKKAHPVSRYAAAAIALFGLWILLTSTVFDEYLFGGAAPGSAWQEVAAGVVVSLLLAFWARRYLPVMGLSMFSPKRWLVLSLYVPVFFYACVKANLDVAYRAVHPKMPIHPGVVAIRTTLKSDVAKLMLANSITLTPGTLTVDVSGDTLFIHWINVKSTDVDEASRLIGGRFEKYLKAIAE